VTGILAEIGPVLTVKDLALYLKVHQTTIYRLLKAGQLPAFRIGSDWRFNVEEIECWLVKREKNKDTSPVLRQTTLHRP
jgi:excisionase family DNA binding protein